MKPNVRELMAQALAIAERLGHPSVFVWVDDTPFPGEYMTRCCDCKARIIIAPRSFTKVPIRGEGTVFHCKGKEPVKWWP